MARTTEVSIEEYLHSSYAPDRDYIDGEIEERNLGEFDHAAVQAALVRWFSRYRKEWDIRVVPEVRVQVSPKRFRVPDICVLSRKVPIEQVITVPPIVCVEVLSPEDTLQRMMARYYDYDRMGVENVWIIDPADHSGYDCRAGGFVRVTEFNAKGSVIRLELDQLFQDID